MIEPIRIGVVGHYTWFSNHFPERWESDENALCLDVNENDYNFLIMLKNFWPDISLLYRPELYPRSLIEAIPGKKIGILSEPLPFYSNGVLEASSETDLRLSVYQSMQWDLFDRVFYYDEGKADTVKYLGWNLSGGFFPLPINTEYFRPSLKPRPIDVCFIGKPTPRRIQILDFLRSANLNFVWIAHGVHGRQLANVLRRSKVVLNIHADDLPAIEPRIFLAASCGCAVVSDALPKSPAYFSDQVFETRDSLSLDYVRYALDQFEQNREKWNRHSENPLGTRRFIRECYNSLNSFNSD